ncbi:MAG TPA: Ig domain-containing protein, partial [Acidobacteriota bacterium]
GILSGTPDTAGTSNFTVTATDSNSDSGNRNYSLQIKDPGACLFCDDFNDGTVDPNWTYVKGTWNESGGELVGFHTRKADAIATPIFTGCSQCTVDTTVQIGNEIDARVSLIAWYVDKKNYVELILIPAKDKIVLKQRLNGAVILKTKAVTVIDPNTSYQIQLGFNGADFSVMLNGSPILTIPPAATPNGTVGFRVKKGTGRFDQISVN